MVPGQSKANEEEHSPGKKNDRDKHKDEDSPDPSPAMH
jgi:hypothetical protein